jgi:hypothetical protein
MNAVNSNDNRRHVRRLPQWLFEEALWDGVLGIVAVFAVVHLLISSGAGSII